MGVACLPRILRNPGAAEGGQDGSLVLVAQVGTIAPGSVDGTRREDCAFYGILWNVACNPTLSTAFRDHAWGVKAMDGHPNGSCPGLSQVRRRPMSGYRMGRLTPMRICGFSRVLPGSEWVEGGHSSSSEDRRVMRRKARKRRDSLCCVRAARRRSNKPTPARLAPSRSTRTSAWLAEKVTRKTVRAINPRRMRAEPVREAIAKSVPPPLLAG
jgi:hypothetical protein